MADDLGTSGGVTEEMIERAAAEADYDESRLRSSLTVSRERTVETRRIVKDKSRIRLAVDPMLTQSRKTVYFAPQFVFTEAHQATDGTWVMKRMFVEGWRLRDERVVVGEIRRRFFDGPLDMPFAPDWLKDHLGRLMTELCEQYPANT